MENKELVTNSGTPSDMIRLAIEQGADIAKLEKLIELKERWEANEARKAFHKAVSEFKKNPPKVTKDKQNLQYKSMYTTLGNLVNTVNPELSRHGLSANWEIEQNGIIKLTCVLTHSMGHSERTSASAPADTSGAKNAIQQIKSTITYLKAVTFESIIGLASSDANFDDDGNGANVRLIDDKEYAHLIELLEDREITHAQFCAYYKIDKVADLPKEKYAQAVKYVELKKKPIK